MTTANLDGIQVPIDTFIDARGFIRFNYDNECTTPAIADHDIQCVGLLADGTIVSGYATALPWRDLIAYRGAYGETLQCHYCDNFVPISEIEELDTCGSLICDDCSYDAEHQ